MLKPSRVMQMHVLDYDHRLDLSKLRRSVCSFTGEGVNSARLSLISFEVVFGSRELSRVVLCVFTGREHLQFYRRGR